MNLGRDLEGLDRLDWTDSLKETQRNWIGRSEGAEMQFMVKSPMTNDQLPIKIIQDNHLYILRGDKTYTATGQEVK